MAPQDPILDPLVHLAYVAAVTGRWNLGTVILILLRWSDRLGMVDEPLPCGDGGDVPLIDQRPVPRRQGNPWSTWVSAGLARLGN